MLKVCLQKIFKNVHFGQKDKDGVIILYMRRGSLRTAKRPIKEVPSRMPELKIISLRKVVNYGIFIKQRINQEVSIILSINIEW